MVEVDEAINEVERALRWCVRTLLPPLNTIEPELYVRLVEKREAERSRRRDVAIAEDPLAYSEISELANLMTRRWEPFAPVFGAKKTFDARIGDITRVRIPASHSRDLAPHERDLISGHAGVLRSAVTRYRSESDEDDLYYPRIDAVSDSFGRELVLSSDGLQGSVREPLIRLDIGDRVEFTARGWDAQGRRLLWAVGNHERLYDGRAHEVEGSEVRLNWTAALEDVGKNALIWVWLTADAPHHAHGRFDEEVAFVFSVRPPSS